jgi:hypothetical protein
VVHRRAVHGWRVAALGLAIALAPLSVASATTHHTTRATHAAAKKSQGSLCKNLEAEQAGSNKVGSSISAAINSGNLAAAKQQIINAINKGLKAAAPVLNQLNSAPHNVQTAIRGLVKLDQTLISSIKKTTSLSGLEAPFAVLAKNPHLKSYAATVNTYLNGKCGSLLSTTTTT